MDILGFLNKQEGLLASPMKRIIHLYLISSSPKSLYTLLRAEQSVKERLHEGVD
jgi:hypothetical protein